MSYLGRSAKLSLKAQEKVSFLATAGQTSKTGLSYTPTFVEVYVNGVLLTDTTDFTATNGNSVTFTVALLLNDEVTVISLKTFTVADHYNKTEADTLLAAKSPLASPSFTGTVTADGLVVQAGNGATATLNLNNADGNGTLSQLNLGYTADPDHGNISYTGDMSFKTGGNVERVRIDSSGHAIIGGGVTLGNGQTYAAANTLDDYEEGTWTPSPTHGTATFSEAIYTKVGRLVTLTVRNLSLSDFSSGLLIAIAGLPFAAATSSAVGVTMVARKDTKDSLSAYIPNSGTSIYFYENSTSSFASFLHSGLNASNNEIYLTISYTTA